MIESLIIIIQTIYIKSLKIFYHKTVGKISHSFISSYEHYMELVQNSHQTCFF